MLQRKPCRAQRRAEPLEDPACGARVKSLNCDIRSTPSEASKKRKARRGKALSPGQAKRSQPRQRCDGSPRAPCGMRVKLGLMARAPKARDKRAQGGRARESGLWHPGMEDRTQGKPCKGGTSALCRPTGLFLLRHHFNPGLRPPCGLRPGPSYAALSALQIVQLSLSCMPFGGANAVCSVALPGRPHNRSR